MNKIFKELINDGKREREALKKRAELRKSLRPRISKIAALVGRLEKKGTIVYSYAYCSESALSLSVNVYNLDGFGGAELLGVLEKFSDVAEVEFNASSDSPEYSMRTYSGVSADGKVRVTIIANLKDNAARCRKVLKRIDRVEKEVYEFECS